MASLNQIFFGILILQIYVYAAPPDVSKLEEIAKVEQDVPSLAPSTATLADSTSSLDSVPTEADDESNGTESQRQKRFYNPYGYGFPPINPVIYPNFNQRDDFPNVGTFGVEDPLLQIHRRVQEIANFARQPQQPQFPPVPIFYPVLFIPPFDCRCNNPQPTSPPAPGPDNNNGSSLDFPSRLPDLSDERQNWGLFINETDTNDTGDGEEDDYSRPISFDPIKPSRPVRPPPPVEHGTVQSDSAGGQRPQSDNDIPPPPQQTPRPVAAGQRPLPSRRPGQSASYPPPQRGPSSPCDVAVLTCCHQPRISYDCFAAQGCPNISSFGNPCEPSAILSVIQRFQNFYANRNG